MLRSCRLLLLLTTPLLAADPRTVTLTVTPSPAPRPALQYELLPPITEQLPGNAATGYLRAGLLRSPTSRESLPAELLLAWDSQTIDQLPIEKLRDYLKPHRDALDQLDLAARRVRCDWQTDAVERPQQSFALLTPSLDTSRELSQTLRFRHRLELAENRFPAALRSLQTGIQLAKHTGESRTILESLVAHNIFTRSLSGVEDWIGRPDSPNLYWALTTLPHPVIDPRSALAHERRFLRTLLGLTDGWDRQVMTEADAVKTIRATFATLKDLSTGSKLDKDLIQFGESDELLTMIGGTGPSAKRSLIANGFPKATIEAMPNAQAVLVRAIQEIEAYWDDCTTAFYRPPHQAWTEWDRLLARHATLQTDWTREPMQAILMRLQVRIVWQLQRLHLRTARTIAQLRALEAIRLVASKDGQLPERLNTIASVPVPHDPFTGEAFLYTRTDTGFTLSCSTPHDVDKLPHVNELFRAGAWTVTIYSVNLRK